MKKLLTLLLALVAVISVIGAGCQLAGSSGTTVTAEEAQKAKTHIEQKYRGESETTASDYKLDAQVGVDGTIVKVEWSANTDKVSIGTELDEYGQVTVKVTKTAEEVSYVLTAKIYDSDRNCLETTFNRKIPAYKLYNWEQYLAAEDGEVFSIEGIVTSIWGKSLGNTYNGMYVQDLENKGGYYVYGLTSDAAAAGVKAGMTVSVTGTYIKNYVELKDASCSILDSTIKTVEPTDYTEIFKNATALTDTALLEKQTLLVTLKGVELQPQSEADVSGSYYRFKLGNLSSYVRISSSVCPMTKEEQAQFKADFAANVGNKADVVGIASAYNGAFYLVPAGAGAYSNYQVVTKTDAEKVETELTGAFLSKTVFTEDETITLPTVKTYNDVTFTWASDSANAVVENGELKITMASTTTTATVTLTVKCGEVEQTKTFTLTLQNMTLNHAGTLADPYDCADTLAILNSLAKGETYKDEAGNPKAVWIKGYVVVEGTAGNFQSKFYLGATKDTAQADAVYVFSANYTDAVKSIKLGDCIVVKGYLMDYNGTKEVSRVKQSDGTYLNVEIVSSDAEQGGETPDPKPNPEEPTTSHAGTLEDPFDCKDALTVLDSLASGTYYMADGAAKAVYIKGYVLDPGTYNSQFGNQNKIYIADAVDSDVKLYVYRAYFSNDITTIAQGDIIIVKGYLTNSTYGKQVSYYDKENAYIVSKTEATQEDIAKLVFATLSVKATLNEDYTLPTSTLATIVWSVKEESAVLTIENGVAKVTRGTADTQVVLVAKIGEMTKEFTVTVVKADSGENPGETKTVTFNLGENVTEKPVHNDGDKTAVTTYTETVDGVTLTITSGTNLYQNANDAKGNGCLKLGTGKKPGSFSITSIPAGVKSIKIYVAAYKAKTASVKANGEETKLTKQSDNGEYDVIEVLIAEGTTEVTFEVSSGNRAMVNAIEFVY